MRFKTFMEDNIPAFNQWFKGSKVVDAAGKPLVVYHATDKEFTKKHGDAKDSFIAFDPEQIKSVNNKGSWNHTNPNIMEADEPHVKRTYKVTKSMVNSPWVRTAEAFKYRGFAP